MSEAADLVVPAPVEGAAAVPPVEAAAPAAAAAEGQDTLNTPETVEGAAAAAEGQGAVEGAAPDGGQSEGEQPAGQKEGEAEQPAAEAAPGAPEAYAEFTMPEGYQLPAELGEGLTTLAKELNLPQEKAQALVDLAVKHGQAFQGAMANALNTAKAGWAEAVRTDPEIGGEQLPVHMATAKKAMAAFGSPALTGLLNDTGLSQHPEFLRMLVRVGEAISEEAEIVTGNGAGGRLRLRSDEDRANRMYPKMKAT